MTQVNVNNTLVCKHPKTKKTVQETQSTQDTNNHLSMCSTTMQMYLIDKYIFILMQKWDSVS